MEALPIASLAPSLPSVDAKSFKGVVTLVWPYSSSTGQLSLLIAEQDFRLRRNKGQVRVHFHGSSAKAVARSGIGIGDVVIVGLEGVQWVQEAGDHVNTPGKSVDWELRYGQRLVLYARREEKQLADINVDDPTPTPQHELSKPYENGYVNGDVRDTDAKTPARKNGFSVTPAAWASPAFLRRARVSSGTLIDSPYDPFTEQDGFLEGRASKRRKQWHEITQWKLADNPLSPGKDLPWEDMEIEDEDGDEDEDSPEGTQSQVAVFESPLSESRPASADVSPGPVMRNTDVHDFAFGPRRSDNEASPCATAEPVPIAQERPIISIQTALQQANAAFDAFPKPSESVFQSQTNETVGSMPPPLLPNALETKPQILSPGPLSGELAKPQTPKLTAVPSSALPLPSPFPTQDQSQFPFPLASSSQEFLPSPLTKGPPDFARPKTPELNPVSSWNLPLPSPFPAEGQNEPNKFLENLQLANEQWSSLEASQRPAGSSSDQASQISLQPDKDYTWKPGEPIHFQPQNEVPATSSETEHEKVPAMDVAMQPDVLEQSSAVAEEPSDGSRLSPLFKLSNLDDTPVQVDEADFRVSPSAERHSKLGSIIQGEEEREDEQTGPLTPTPIPGSSPNKLQLQYRGDTPSDVIEILSEEELSDNELENEDIDMGEEDVVDFNEDEESNQNGGLVEVEQVKLEEEGDEDSDELVEPLEESEEDLESSPLPEEQSFPTYEDDSNEEVSPGRELESPGSGPSEEATSSSEIAEAKQYSRQEAGTPSQDEPQITDSVAYPSLDSQQFDPVAQRTKMNFPFGLDGSILSDPVPRGDNGTIAFVERKEIDEMDLEDETDTRRSDGIDTSSPRQTTYVFEDESGEEQVSYRHAGSSSPLASENILADEESAPLPISQHANDQLVGEFESSQENLDDEETATPLAIPQSTIIDLGVSSDAEEVNEEAAKASGQGQPSFGQPLKEQEFLGISADSGTGPDENDGLPEENMREVINDAPTHQPSSSHPGVEIIGETQVNNLQNLLGHPMTPDKSQRSVSDLQPIQENGSLDQASTAVLPPTPRLTQPSQDVSSGISSQSFAPPAVKQKATTRRSTRLSSTPEATTQPSQESERPSSPSSQRTQTSLRRSARISSSMTPRPRTPERQITSSISPPSTKKTPTRRSERLSSSPAQTMRDGPLPTSSSPTPSLATSATDKTPTRRSERVRQRQVPRVSEVPEVLTPWFGPRRSSKAQGRTTAATPAHLPRGAIISERGEVIVPDSEETGTSNTATSPSASHTHDTPPRSSRTTSTTTGKSAPDRASAAAAATRQSKPKPKPEPKNSRPPTSSLLSQDPTLGIRTPHAYYTPLSTLPTLLNPSSSNPASPPTYSILALAASASSPPQRAKSGPRDWFTEFSVCDHLLRPRGESVRARVFRPYKSALPAVGRGEAVLLRGFEVKGRKGGVELVSGEGSGWVVWRMGLGRGSGSGSGSGSGGGSGKRVSARKAEGRQGEGEDGGEGTVWARRRTENGFVVWEEEGWDVLGREEMKGPPVEFGEEEREVVRALREWWVQEVLDEADQEGGEEGSEEGGDGEAGESKHGRKKGNEREKNGTVVHELRDGSVYRDGV